MKPFRPKFFSKNGMCLIIQLKTEKEEKIKKLLGQ